MEHYHDHIRQFYGDGEEAGHFASHAKVYTEMAVRCAILRALKAAQPQENKERSENSPASPVQQLQAKIASAADRLHKCNTYGANYHIREIQSVIDELRQLAAM